MVRAILVLAVLSVVLGAILVRLWASGFPARVALKMTFLAAGFVVSVKMVLGGYLALQGETEPTLVRLIGLGASLGLTLFFGAATLSLWRRGTSSSASASRSMHACPPRRGSASRTKVGARKVGEG